MLHMIEHHWLIPNIQTSYVLFPWLLSHALLYSEKVPLFRDMIAKVVLVVKGYC